MHTYIKITEGTNTVYLSTEHYKNVSGVIGMLNEAVKHEDSGQTFTNFIRHHCGDAVLISPEDWSNRKSEESENIVDTDFNEGVASLYSGRKDERVTISGEIFRLTGCYEQSIENGKVDVDQLMTELMHHCSVVIPRPVERTASNMDMVQRRKKNHLMDR